MPPKLITTFDLMRHGEPVGGRKYRGQMNDPLSDKGWAQMREAVGDHCPWQIVVSSPLLRCAEFSRELAGRHQLPLVIDHRLTELGFGAWEGRTADELIAENPDILMKFRSDPITHAPPGAEPLAAFQRRILAAWDVMIETHRGKNVLVVTHAGVIRMLVAHVLNIPLTHVFRLQVFSASISRIRVEQDGGQILPQLLFHDGRL